MPSDPTKLDEPRIRLDDVPFAGGRNSGRRPTPQARSRRASLVVLSPVTGQSRQGKTDEYDHPSSARRNLFGSTYSTLRPNTPAHVAPPISTRWPSQIAGRAQMKKSDFTSHVVPKVSRVNSAVATVFNSLISVTTDALAGVVTITIAGFGTFSTNAHSARSPRNLPTDESTSSSLLQRPFRSTSARTFERW